MAAVDAVASLETIVRMWEGQLLLLLLEEKREGREREEVDDVGVSEVLEGAVAFGLELARPRDSDYFAHNRKARGVLFSAL